MSWMDDDIVEGGQQASPANPSWMNDDEIGWAGDKQTGGGNASWDEDHPDAPGAPVQAKKDPDVYDMFKGGMEAVGTLITGATAGTLGQVGGAVKGAIDVALDPELDFGTRQAAEHIRDTADGWGGAFTYEPRTETGREYVETVGEVMAPMEAIEPLIAGGGLTAAGRRAANNNRRRATDAFDDPQRNVNAGDRIVYDERGAPMHIANDAQSRTAMARLGIPPEMMNQFKYASPETRQAMIEMIHRGRNRLNDSEAPNARSVMGEYIGGRAQLAQTAMQKHGAAIDDAALSRKGTHVLTNDISTSYNALLEKQRIRVGDDGKLDFEGSSIPQSARGQLQEIHDRMSKYGADGYGDFDELHKYKQYLSDIASYDRQATGGSAGVQKIVKGLRKQINDTLGANASDYKAANAGYAEIAGPMRKVLKKAGENVDDLSDAEVVERFALQARGLTNNTQGGIDLRSSMDAINKAIKNNSDMFTPEELQAAGMSAKGDVRVNMQGLADLGAYTDRLMPDKPTSFGVLTTDASKAGVPTKQGLIDELYEGVKTVAAGGSEAKALKEGGEARRGYERRLG